MSRTNEFHVLQGRSAGFVTRLFAYLADFAVIAGLIAVTGWLAVLADNVIESLGINLRVDLTTIFLFFTPFLIGSYFVLFWSLTGRTVGKWFMGLKVVGRNGRPPSIGRSLLRLIGYVLSALVLWAGYWWVIIDDERKAWHDHLAKTSVIYDYERQRGGDVYERYRRRAERS
jgi:uncharacterized RDD family membrane protein YckC